MLKHVEKIRYAGHKVGGFNGTIPISELIPRLEITPQGRPVFDSSQSDKAHIVLVRLEAHEAAAQL